MIEVKKLTKTYGPLTAVDAISFSVEPGQACGFLGPNGAGKTTTMRIVTGYMPASSGTVTVDGYDIFEDSFEVRRRVGYLPEHPPLYNTLDVTGYLRFVAKAKGIPRNETPAELDRVVMACRLEAVVKREIFKLSKGYRQRVGLAQALLGKPSVLLLDEPTIGLDPGQILETREVIRSFGESHTVLLSTHILPEVTLICQRVAIINDGRLLAIDTPHGLQSAVERTNIVSLRVTAPEAELREELLALEGIEAATFQEDGGALIAYCKVGDREGIEAAIARAVAGRWDLHRLERQEPTLENIFLHYVKDAQQEAVA